MGRLYAIPARGTLLGNRGILHDDQQRVVRPWAHKSWITCVLSFAGIRRRVFSPHAYSELFFLDEATALAAGHRPCATCQRARFLQFKAAWAQVHPPRETRLTVAQIDPQLHDERTIRGGDKRTYDERLADLPSGTIFSYKEESYLVWNDGYFSWSFTGYAAARAIDLTAYVNVLTPRSIVEMLRLGFEPGVHPTAIR